MSHDPRIAELEQALADTSLALEQAQERLDLLPTLYEGQQDAAGRLGDAQAAYETLAAAHEALLAAHAELQARHRALDADRGRLAHAYQTILESRSWRLTRPLRRAAKLLHRSTPNSDAPPNLTSTPPERAPIAAAAAFPAPVPPAPAPKSPLRTRWEYPPSGALVSDYLHISGWAVGDGGIVEATLRCGGRSHRLRRGRPRWDVAALFPSHADAAGAGFEAVVPATALPPGSQELELFVRDAQGNESRERREVRLDGRAAYAEWRAALERPASERSTPQVDSPLVIATDETPAAALRRLEEDSRGWTVVVSADARLTEDALTAIAEAIAERADVDALYGDHDVLGPDGERERPFLKPGWSPELLESLDYVGPIVALRRERLAPMLGACSQIPAPGDVLLELANDPSLRVERIPRVLASVLPHGDSRPRPTRAARAEATRARPDVSVLIASADRHGLLERCLASLRERTRYDRLEVVVVDTSRDGLGDAAAQADRVLDWDRPFNYSAVNNLAAEHAAGEFLTLLNDDTEVLTSDWVERLLDFALRPGVGVVGAKLVRPDGTLQHGGARLVRRFAAAKNLFEGLPADDAGPRSLLTVPRNCSAVTFACAMVERRLYDELGGLDPELKVTFNDVDFCLRALRAGRRIVWTPHVELVHHEHGSRGTASFPADTRVFRERWSAFVERVDPYYHPELSDIVDHELMLGHERALTATG